MTSKLQTDLWVFREGNTICDGQSVLRELRDAVARLSRGSLGPEPVISALLRAGEIESALADSGSESLPQVTRLTDWLASVLLRDERGPAEIEEWLRILGRLNVPQSVSLSPPEGFAYYALHPLDFADLARTIAVNCAGGALVVGIRSIGTTLSAIVTAALRENGCLAERLTVRPTGHPYDRRVHLSQQQRRQVDNHTQRLSTFYVVDEGPGRSGSSFLSVAEALVNAGVPRERVRLLGSRQVDPAQLCAPDAVPRWNSFRFLWPKSRVYERFAGHIYVGGGEWRKFILGDASQPPASWPQMERLKFLSPDRKSLFKFEGYGRFGETVLERAHWLAKAGFAGAAENGGDGMVRYQRIAGRPQCPSDVSATVLTRIADYCAYRYAEFGFRSENSQLADMLRFNVLEEFGTELKLERNELDPANPVLVDGRMQAHEWIADDSGRLLKVDGLTHGDDHFFPGPTTDIAWDLAGAIVEWKLKGDAQEFLLRRFHRVTGDNPRRRLPLYVLAYTVFRLGYCKMALSTVRGTPDESALRQAYEGYRAVAAAQIEELTRLAAASSRTCTLDKSSASSAMLA